MKTKPLLDADEWDFRGLVDVHFGFALRYELARERVELKEALALLTPDRHKEIEALTLEEWEAWTPDWVSKKRFWRLWDFFWIWWCCSEFPKPWMSLTESQRAGAAQKCGADVQPLRVLTREELGRIEAIEDMASRFEQTPPNQNSTRSIRRYIIEIDWGRADDPILKPLLLELLNLRPEGIRPIKHHTGKKAAVPLHKFKQLAAWRLATKAGLRHKDALRMVGQRTRDYPRSDPSDLLPIYPSAGAWKNAVDAGEKLISRAR